MKTPKVSKSALDAEFVTVRAVLNSGGTTRRVDALALSWIKAEKQARRLFCFLVFQHPNVSDANQDDYVAALVDERGLYMDGFVRGIDQLSPRSLREIVGSEYEGLMADIERVRIYRNKLMHGQITGQKITSRQLEKDIKRLETWITAVARGCDATFSYDGVARNTFRKARAAEARLVTSYPFSTVPTFGDWLRTLRRAQR